MGDGRSRVILALLVAAAAGAGVAYDAGNDCLVLFGSQYASDEKTWIYRYKTGQWESHDLEPHPIGKKLGTYSTIPRLCYDSVNGVCLCITWDTNSGKHETWALDVGKLRWTKMNPPTERATEARNFCQTPAVFIGTLQRTPNTRTRVAGRSVSTPSASPAASSCQDSGS